MAVKKKAASKVKVKPKRPIPKPKRKASPAPKRAQPKAKAAGAPKKAQTRAAVAEPKPRAGPARSPEPVTAAPPPPQPSESVVRPGLQKRPDAAPVGVVSVTDGDRLIEQSTFYSASGRDEYVRRWEARGYTCRFTAWNN
jgi:hypothetical protein